MRMLPQIKIRHLLCIATLGACGVSLAAAADIDSAKLPPAAQQTIDFAREIEPIFAAKCVGCHGPAKQKGEFRLDQRTAALKGGDTYAPDIIPGKSAESPLVQLVAGLVDGMQMPPEGERLTNEQIGLLRAWIDQGAKWPEEATAIKTKHWAWEPLRRGDPPQSAKSSNPIDAFLSATLRERGLSFSPAAEPRTLIRRTCATTIGLPPTFAEVTAFESAYRRNPTTSVTELADRLLASPRYGERWARHWLDVVRFAESNGFEMNTPRKNACCRVRHKDAAT